MQRQAANDNRLQSRNLDPLHRANMIVLWDEIAVRRHGLRIVKDRHAPKHANVPAPGAGERPQAPVVCIGERASEAARLPLRRDRIPPNGAATGSLVSLIDLLTRIKHGRLTITVTASNCEAAARFLEQLQALCGPEIRFRLHETTLAPQPVLNFGQHRKG